MKKIIYTIIILLILTLGFLWYLGYFTEYKVEERITEPLAVAY